MTMTHNEALKIAVDEWFSGLGGARSVEIMMPDMAAAIRAYIAARGLVMVPREPTEQMWEAGEDCGIRMYTGTVTYVPTSVYRAMLFAAPDPFKE